MATQLGGWSYARTVFSSESKNEEKTGSNEGGKSSVGQLWLQVLFVQGVPM